MDKSAKIYMDKLFKEYMLPDRFPLIAVSTFFAGYFFGENGLAAFSYVLPIYFLFVVAGFAINFGAFSLSIKAVGKSQGELAKQYSSMAMLLSLVAGIILTAAVNLFFYPLIEFLEVPPEILPLVESYGRPLAFFGFFLVISIYILQFLKLIGMQKQLKFIYKIMLVLNAAVIFFCVKILNLGMESLAVGMMTAAIFCIIFEGLQLYKKIGKNLFAPIKFSEIPLLKILKAGSAITFSKIFSLSQILIYNFFLFQSFGLAGVAVFASLQIAIRVCRTGSGMTLQPITPILTIELEDKNLSAILLLLKTAIKRGMIFAVGFTVILLFFGEKFTENPMTLEALQIYALSLIPAAINAIMLTIFLTVGHIKFANFLAFMRSFFLLIIFLLWTYQNNPQLVWWSFLFAEILTLVMIICGGLIMAKKFNLKTPLLIDTADFQPTIYFVLDRKKGFTDELHGKLEKFLKNPELQKKCVEIISEVMELSKKFSDLKKDNFTAVQISKTEKHLKIILRSNGKLFDYKKFIPQDWNFKFVLGLNNFYVVIENEKN